MRFAASRLSLGRRRRGQTKRQLATTIDMHVQSISDYENGKTVPPERTIEAIATALRFPSLFFFGQDLEEPNPDSASFRSLSSMTAARRGAALASGALAFELGKWIEDRFNIPAPNVPTVRPPSPEEAALYVRNKWGLGETPIKNMVHLLEANGVRVFSLAEDSKDVDAFSIWKNDIPYVFLNTYKSAEHGRFDAAHELGHLVLHRHGGPHGRDAEHEANLFASEFLMPRGSVLAANLRITGLESCIQAKSIWSVSVAALVYKLHKLNIISDWHYRSLFIEMGQLGMRDKEPNGMLRETSQVFAKVFAALREEGISKEDIAKQLSLYPEDVDALVFGLAMIQLSGGRSTTNRSSKRANLRLVD